jgi:hypothetical protein
MKSILLLILSTSLALGDASLVNGKGQGITDAAAFRSAIQAQSNVSSFEDRFDDSTRYSNGATISHLSSMPFIGPAWRLSTGAGIVPSVTIPPMVQSTFQGEADDDILTIAAGHSYLTGFPIRLSGAGLPAPLVLNTTYYVIKISGTQVKLATNTANAIAGTAINLTTDGSAAQGLISFGMARGLAPSDGSGLFYLGSAVQTANGKFVLAFEFTPVLTDAPSGASDLGLNISFANTTMISAGGGIDPTDVVHINVSAAGVVTCDFYDAVSAVAIPSTTTPYVNNAYQWNPRGTRWVTGRKQVLILVVDGDRMRVISPGHGSVEFYHADLSTKVSASTNFWWEPSGSVAPGASQFYRRKCVLHRVTDSLEKVQLEQWGMEEASNLSGDSQSVILSRLRVLGDPAVTWTSGNDPTSSDNYYLATPQKIRGDKGFWSRPYAGYADYTVPLTQNLVSTEISASAGDSNTSRLSMTDFPMVSIGDWGAWDLTGSFAANGNSKGVQIYLASAGATLVQTGAITPNGGTWRARIKRVYLTGRSHDYYGEIAVTSGGTTTVYTGRLEYNSGAVALALQMRLSAVAAGDVKIQQGAWAAEIR